MSRPVPATLLLLIAIAAFGATGKSAEPELRGRCSNLDRYPASSIWCQRTNGCR